MEFDSRSVRGRKCVCGRVDSESFRELTESRGTNEDKRYIMHITDIMRGDSPTFSFEFFPPKTPEAAELLYQTIRDLESYMPHFVSVTYGAGGSTRDLTHDLVERIQHTTKLDPIPHLTCICHNEEEVETILLRYARSAIGNILALGGDRPRDIPYDKSRDSFQHAVDLVKFIRRFNESGAHPDRRGFGIGVAGFPEGHPATPNRLVEMDHLKAKVDAGADYMVTQLFFDNRDFFDFRERCALAGIHVPIIAGIMPITSMSGFKRIAELAGGARFPAKLLRALQRCENDPERVRRVGVHFALEQCHDLLDNNVAGIHFYTLNRSDATRMIFDSLGIPRRGAHRPLRFSRATRFASGSQIERPQARECREASCILAIEGLSITGPPQIWWNLRGNARRIWGCPKSAVRFTGSSQPY